MDSTDPDIFFDSNGVCHYCRTTAKKILNYRYSSEQEHENLKQLAKTIKSRKKGEYDSILGLSGGVDSSYVAYLAMEMGLNPLCVHFDNGWNSEVAVNNIRKIIDVTGFDLKTYVIDWPEFRDLQRSFFKAGVIDIEMLTDHAIFATLFKIRKEFKITTVLSGTNYATEHGMPPTWLWSKMDSMNIKSIHKKFGELSIRTFPMMSSFYWLLMRQFGIGGVFEEPLNIINYSKKEAMLTLERRFEWKYYGGKHYESLFTKFYQAYVLPTKFGIDKRKVHYSDLIRNGEIDRNEAVFELNKPLYSEIELRKDKDFVLKKLGFTEVDFDELISKKPVPHDFYSSDRIYIKPLIYLGKKILSK